MINEFIFRTKEFVCIFLSFIRKCDEEVVSSTILRVRVVKDVILCVASSEEDEKEAIS